MPEYRRAFQPGGTFFFTVVTYHRRRFLCETLARRLLHEAIVEMKAEMPFEMPASVLQPDHLHCLWVLPEEDADFSTRWARIKKTFTERWLAAGGRQGRVTPAQGRRQERGVWQPRFWEHTIRDERDFEGHLNYIHYNPVKHGWATCPHAWPYSSFSRWVARRVYAPDWQCSCGGHRPEPPSFDDLDTTAME